MNDDPNRSAVKAVDLILNRLASLEWTTQSSFRSISHQLRKAEKRALVQAPAPNFAAELPRRVHHLRKLLQVSTVVGFDKIRVGGAHDGGYVCVDDFGGSAGALSFGIGDDVSWDLDLARRNIIVHQYDHTVQAPPQQYANFRFNNQRLAGEPKMGEASLASIFSRLQRTSSDSYIMKMDIEGDEWEVLRHTPADCFDHISQMVCEFHGLHGIHADSIYEKIAGTLKLLSEHFAVVHIHSNNNAPIIVLGNVPFYQTLEVTFLNKKKYNLVESDESFPMSLDAPNKADVPDHFIGHFFTFVADAV